MMLVKLVRKSRFGFCGFANCQYQLNLNLIFIMLQSRIDMLIVQLGIAMNDQ
jgi:hypothetical protein